MKIDSHDVTENISFYCIIDVASFCERIIIERKHYILENVDIR